MNTTSTDSVTAERRLISLALIDPMKDACSLDMDYIARLQSSIAAVGLIQPIVVVRDGDRFRSVAGAHRTEAKKRNGDVKIDALVLPAGTPPEVALQCSLHENHVRHDESLPDTVKRVTALMNVHGLKSFAEGAKLAGLSKANLSKMQLVMAKFSPRCLSLVHDHRLGAGICYEIAQHAESEEEQYLWLRAHVKGDLTRAAIVGESKKREAVAKAARKSAQEETTARKKIPPVKLQGVVDGVKVRLVIPPYANAAVVGGALATLATRFQSHLESQQPLSSFSINEPLGDEP
jgi:ParB-like chromosome segregation protein Spo0J